MRRIALLILFICFSKHNYAIKGVLVKTIDYSFQEKWNNTVGSSTPILTTFDTVFKKQYFFLTSIAWDYALDNQDIANVQYSIKIIKPDNTIFLSQENLPLVNTKMSNNNLQMSDRILKVSFDNNEMFGTYKIELEILDKVSGKTKKIESDITLSELPSYMQYKVNDENDFTTWFDEYYKNPQPERALSYYIFYSHSSLADNESGFWTLLSFFLEITKNNVYLLPQIMDCFKSQDLKTKIYLLYLLKYSNLGTNDFYASLDGDEKTAYLKIKDTQLTDMYGTISEPSQLDMLWGTFMASGSYQPVLKLIQTLDYTRYQGDLDKFKKSKQTDENRKGAVNNAIYNSLVWSLKSNCNQHELVKEYCNWALQFESLSTVQKDELKKILTK